MCFRDSFWRSWLTSCWLPAHINGMKIIHWFYWFGLNFIGFRVILTFRNVYSSFLQPLPLNHYVCGEGFPGKRSSRCPAAPNMGTVPKKPSPRSPRLILKPWSLRSTVLICLHTDRSYCSSSHQERQQRWYLQAIPLPPRLTDLRQLSFLVHRGAPACCLAVINGRQFQGSLPWRSAGAVRWRSVTDCRVINCRDGEQVISMQRCFPPDRSIQGPHLVTVVIIASPSELLDSAGARL